MSPKLLAAALSASILTSCLLAQRSSIGGERLTSAPPNQWVNLILRMRNVKAPDGKYKNLAVDVVEKKYYWVDLPYLSGGKSYVSRRRRRRPAPDFRVNSAMRCDARRKLVWVHNPVSFWVLKFDRKTARMTEAK